jgi:hypothetical protein
MLVLLAGMFGLVVGQVRGGRLLNLADLRVRGWGLIVIALAAQLLVAIWFIPDPRVPVALDGALLLCSYVALLVVAWQNRVLVGMWLVGIGIALNVVAAIPHGGLLPTTPEALQSAGRAVPAPLPGPSERPYVQSKDIVLPRDQIPFWAISDRFAIPRGWPLSGVFSPGDVLIALGLGWVLEQGMLTQPVFLRFVASK